MNQHLRLSPIPFIDLAAQRLRLGGAIDDALARVTTHCQFVNGPEVGELEGKLAAFTGARHVVSCASGTDALLMALMAEGVGPADAVICPSFTFCATAEAVAIAGATPVLVDVDEATFNIDISSCERGIATARRFGLRVKGIIPVDLFGQAADFAAIEQLAAAEKLFVLDDAAQGFGATYRNRRLGTFGHATATSFFPAKPLGCFGDGGAIFTDDDEFADRLRSIRIHGQGSDKYDNIRLGLTGRLDTIQAAILLQKLTIFEDEITARERIAQRYNQGLAGAVIVPGVADGRTSVWAQYTIRVSAARRDAIAADLKTRGVPTAIYYQRPLHRQTAYQAYPVADGGAPISERLSGEVLSLPMHPYLDEPTQDRVIAAVRAAVAG